MIHQKVNFSIYTTSPIGCAVVKMYQIKFKKKTKQFLYGVLLSQPNKRGSFSREDVLSSVIFKVPTLVTVQCTFHT